MHVTEIAVTRIYNIGNYENIRYEIRAALDSIDDPKTVVATVEKLIHECWIIKAQEVQET